MNTEIKNTENVVIVGSGPAGYTAALYTARADLEPLVIEGFAWGGLLQQTTDVENYPGFPEGVQGPEMMQRFRDQAERFGTRFITDDATRIELADEEGGIHRVWVGDQEIRARAVILAMGAEPRKLGVPGEEELAARGVSYCATCDAAFHRGADTLVVGGGDTAMEEATFLAKFAGKVTVVNRRNEFRASAIMADRARDTENIEFLTPYVVERFEPGAEGSLATAVLKNVDDGSERVIEVTGAFVGIGHRPNSHLVEDQLDTDENGYLEVEGRTTRTRVPGVFAAGDLTDHVYRQAITAAGTGCMSALDAEAYLRDTPIDAEAHWAPDPAKVEAAAESAASA
jgi:thioredoxin reductase (NADPH)